MPKIIHYRDDCIGCNSCIEYAQQYWELDEEDGKSNLKQALEKKGVWQRDILDMEVPENLEAAHNCPMQIIKILNEQGKEL